MVHRRTTVTTALALAGLGASPASADSLTSPYTVRGRLDIDLHRHSRRGPGPQRQPQDSGAGRRRRADQSWVGARSGSGPAPLPGPDVVGALDLYGVTFEGAGMGSTLITNNATAATDTEPFDMTASDRITIRDLTVKAGGPLRSTSDAIDFDGGDFVVIEGLPSGSRGRGIVFDGKGHGSLAHADDNVIRDCWVHDVPSDGIELLASDRNLVEEVSRRQRRGHGIQITKASSVATQPNKPSNENTIRRNDIDQAGSDGINVNSGNKTTSSPMR